MHRSTFISAISIFVVVSLSQAALLDWNKVDWTQGNETQTFTDVEGSGIDITIALSLSYDWEYQSKYRDGYWSKTDWINNAPDDTNTFGGDGSTKDGESLYLGLNFASDDRTKSYLDVTITFSQAVEGANFSLFDVDSYGTDYYGGYERGIQFVDIIEHVSGSNNGSDVASTVTHDSSKILEGSNSEGTYYQGNTSLSNSSDQNDNSRSVVNLAWSSPVDTVSFRYTGGSGAVADPGNQAIGLSNIGFCEYSAVPEPSTVITALLLPIAGFLTYRRRKNKAQASA